MVIAVSDEEFEQLQRRRGVWVPSMGYSKPSCKPYQAIRVISEGPPRIGRSVTRVRFQFVSCNSDPHAFIVGSYNSGSFSKAGIYRRRLIQIRG